MSSMVQKDVKEKARLVFDEHEEFNRTIEGEDMTTLDLAAKINNIFDRTFYDFSGSKILFNEVNQLTCELVFEPTPKQNNEERLCALKEIIAESSAKNEFVRKCQVMNKVNKITSRFDLTDEAKEILSDYLGNIVVQNGVRPATINDLRPNLLISELAVQNGMYSNSHRIKVVVRNLDPYKLIRDMYGVKLNGTEYDYKLEVKAPIANTQEFILTISRVDKNSISNLARKANISVPGYNYVRKGEY